MSKTVWTPQQNDAITARGSTLLVSAAAGSGKTAVLVERVLQRITDSENPCNIDDLLIVTFTEAAASEMREKIARSISEKLAEKPYDLNLEKQLALLSKARISTVHSFCTSLLRQNFHMLDIPPDFKIADEWECGLIKQQVLQDTIEKWYEKPDRRQDFFAAVELFSSGNSDSGIAQTVSSIYEFVSSHPFPEQWLIEKKESFNPCNVSDIASTAWGKVLIKYAHDLLCHALGRAKLALDLATRDNVIFSAYSDALNSDINQICELLSLIQGGDWDKIYSRLQDLSFEKLRPAKNCTEVLKQQVQQLRAEVKEIASLKDVFLMPTKDFLDELGRAYPVVSVLFDVVIDYARAYSAEKQRRGVLDFADLEHYTLKLLVESFDISTGEYVKTDFATEFSKTLVEIIVDEYQDINETQDLIFRAVSKDEKNIFMVGDVKQSIYRFRQAMPQIFLSYKETFAKYDKDKPASKCCITLDRNFRSRQSVIDTVNFIFGRLMSKELGELDYTKEEELTAGAQYCEDANGAYCSELCIINGDTPDADDESMPDEDEQKLSGAEREARYVAQRIIDMVSGGYMITDPQQKALRPVRYGDIAILLRSVQSTAAIFESALLERNIPVYSGVSSAYFATPEVLTILSLLKVINNPLDDIALAGVMKSPIFGFTADELAEIRMAARKQGFYFAVKQAAEQGNTKCSHLLEKLNEYRVLSQNMPVYKLIWRIYIDTGFMSLAAALPSGEIRQGNLKLLYEYARRYEDTSFKGLYSFVQYISLLMEKGAEVESAKPPADANSVRIMSIHKSKGLEFPVCFVCGLGSQFNLIDVSQRLLLHKSLGAGFKMKDPGFIATYDTLHRKALAIRIKNEALSEEMRVLYVALTRAREKLIMTMYSKDVEKDLKLAAQAINADETLSPFKLSTFKSPGLWILAALAGDIDCENLGGGLKTPYVGVKIVSADRIEAQALENNAEPADAAEIKADTAAFEAVKSRLSFVYPYKGAEGIPSKFTVTELKGKKYQNLDEYPNYHAVNIRVPDFSPQTQLSSAERGTAIHLFMQFADFASCGSEEGVLCEIERLKNMGLLSELQAKAIPPKKILDFFATDLARSILSSKQLYREKRFNILLDVCRLLPEYAHESFAHEKVMLQGVIDCCFIEDDGTMSVVDFKSDYLFDAAAFVERYKSQLDLYAIAMEEITGLKVTGKYIYSFSLSQVIEL